MDLEGKMTNPPKVTAFLRDHRGQTYCDDCLQKALEFKNRQQVNHVTSALATVGCFKSVMGKCCICGEQKTVINAP